MKTFNKVIHLVSTGVFNDFGHYSKKSCSFLSLCNLANACAATEVSHSNWSETGSLIGTTGEIFYVQCNDGYSSGGSSRCGEGGVFQQLHATETDTWIPGAPECLGINCFFLCHAHTTMQYCPIYMFVFSKPVRGYICKSFGL